MPVVPMFPLGSVLMPGMPLSLRVFEPRYLALVSQVLAGSGEFGVVLIERGSEVGGGDHRFNVGTLARIVSVSAEDGWVGVSAIGDRRFAVLRWLPEEPFPLAEVRFLPSLGWSDELEPAFQDADRAVRRALARASEFGTHPWPADVGLSADRELACWQLAGVAPVGSLDRLSLLSAASLGELLGRLAEQADDTAQTLDVAGIEGLWLTGDDPPSG